MKGQKAREVVDAHHMHMQVHIHIHIHMDMDMDMDMVLESTLKSPSPLGRG